MFASDTFFRRANAAVLAAAVLLIHAGTANAQDKSCDLAKGMAVDAYNQVEELMKRKVYFDAFQQKDVFWTIAGHSLGCEEVQALAQSLRKSRLGPNDKYAGPYPDEVRTGPYGASGAGVTGSGTASSGSSSSSGTGDTTDSGATSSSSGSTGTSGTSGTTGR